MVNPGTDITDRITEVANPGTEITDRIMEVANTVIPGTRDH